MQYKQGEKDETITAETTEMVVRNLEASWYFGMLKKLKKFKYVRIPNLEIFNPITPFQIGKIQRTNPDRYETVKEAFGN